MCRHLVRVAPPVACYSRPSVRNPHLSSCDSSIPSDAFICIQAKPVGPKVVEELAELVASSQQTRSVRRSRSSADGGGE